MTMTSEEINTMTFEDIEQRIDIANENPLASEEKLALAKKLKELVESVRKDIERLEK